MQVKLLEIRDEGTMFSALCVDMNPGKGLDVNHERDHLRHCGYSCDGEPNILMTSTSANGTPSTNDYYFWNDRTFSVAHRFIIENWNDLNTGDVVDVEFILGETTEKKKPEIGLPYDEIKMRYGL